MDPAAQLALVNSLPVLIASIGTVLSGIITLRISESKAQAERGKEEVTKKLDQIHELTNSNLSELRDQIKAQEALIREMLTQQADEAKAQIPPIIPPGPPLVGV